jgi:hypothetical protein
MIAGRGSFQSNVWFHVSPDWRSFFPSQSLFFLCHCLPPSLRWTEIQFFSCSWGTIPNRHSQRRNWSRFHALLNFTSRTSGHSIVHKTIACCTIFSKHESEILQVHGVKVIIKLFSSSSCFNYYESSDSGGMREQSDSRQGTSCVSILIPKWMRRDEGEQGNRLPASDREHHPDCSHLWWKRE